MIGDKIKERRLALNMTQEELAKKLNYKSKSTINKIELNINDITQSKITAFAKALKTTPSQLMGWDEDDLINTKGIKIPILGRVVAGIPVEAIEDIRGYEEITPELASQGSFFALEIKGKSMSPRMEEGDVVIVKQQSDAECGDVAVALVNGHDATIKKIKKYEDGSLSLIPINPTFQPLFYSAKEVVEEPVSIIGKVIELRAKF